MADYRKPLPIITQDSEAYWAAAKEHRLTAQRCDDCGRLRFPPSASCWYCLSPHTTWVDLSGKGTIWSFIVMHQLYYPGFADDLPYPVVVVELEGGLRVASNIVGIANEDIRIGMPVQVVFDDVTPEVTLPKFRPA